ncbi:6-bladed beta-propeller [Gemmatimonadota bacterium]
MKRQHCGFLLLIIVFLISACSSRSGPPGYAFRVFQENGVTIAETTGGPKYDGELFVYEQELVLFENPDIEESILFRPLSFTVDQNGYFYVVDSGDKRIAVFDPEGNFSHSFGRGGDGPGEFTSVNLQYVHDGIASIWDYNHQRLTRFRTDGTLLDVITSPDRSRSVTGIYLTSEGNRVLLASTGHQPESGFLLDNARAIITDPVGDTLATVETPWTITGFSIPSNPTAWSRVEFTGDPIIQYHPEYGILATTGGTPDISLYSAAGVLSRQIRVDLEPEPVSEEERRRIIEIADGWADRASGPSRARSKERRDALKILEYKAFWEDVQVDQNGYFWLRIPEMYESYRESGGTLYRVLSPEGEYLGDTRWPSISGTPGDGRLFTRESDEETGQTRLVVYRIRPAVEGLRFP